MGVGAVTDWGALSLRERDAAAAALQDVDRQVLQRLAGLVGEALEATRAAHQIILDELKRADADVQARIDRIERSPDDVHSR